MLSGDEIVNNYNIENNIQRMIISVTLINTYDSADDFGSVHRTDFGLAGSDL